MPLSNEVRIIGGKWKRRKLRFPNRAELRPTLDRVRVTLFNWLVGSIHDAICLDLYAGSGALGFEALSRGARETTFVERDPVAAHALELNRERLGATGAHVVRADALRWLERCSQRFDLVFLDPPFASDELRGALATLRTRNLLAEDARVYVELAARSSASFDGFAIVKESRAGHTRYVLLRADSV